MTELRLGTNGYATAAGGETCDLLIRNGYVLTLDDARAVYPTGAVAIRGNRIVAVGPDREVARRSRH